MTNPKIEFKTKYCMILKTIFTILIIYRPIHFSKIHHNSSIKHNTKQTKAILESPLIQYTTTHTNAGNI